MKSKIFDNDWFEQDYKEKISKAIEQYNLEEAAKQAQEQYLYEQKIRQYEQMLLKSQEQHKDFIIQQQKETIEKLEKRVRELEFKNKFEDMLHEK